MSDPDYSESDDSELRDSFSDSESESWWGSDEESEEASFTDSDDEPSDSFEDDDDEEVYQESPDEEDEADYGVSGAKLPSSAKRRNRTIKLLDESDPSDEDEQPQTPSRKAIARKARVIDDGDEDGFDPYGADATVATEVVDSPVQSPVCGGGGLFKGPSFKLDGGSSPQRQAAQPTTTQARTSQMGAPPPPPCPQCGQQGHRAKDCPTNPYQCRACGQMGL